MSLCAYPKITDGTIGPRQAYILRNMVQLQSLRPPTVLALLLIPAMGAIAQGTRGATIAGTVRDSAGMPILAADVVAQPGHHRTRTDSAGTFLLTGLDDGAYTIAA